MNYLPVSSLRWAPASAQQWLRHFHHHGRGDRHIWGWPVHGAGMYNGQILSQLKLRQKHESLRERKTGAGRSDRVGPPGEIRHMFGPWRTWLLRSKWAIQHSSTKTPSSVSTVSVDMLLARFPAVTPRHFCLVWLPWWPDSQAQLSHCGGSHVIFSSSSHLASCCHSPSHYWGG